MVMCWAPDCKHYNQREKCKFFKFPQDVKERRKWKKLIRRNVEPGPGAFVCSCHFLNGERKNGPTLFAHNEGKRFEKNYLTPEKICPEGQLLNKSEEPQPSTSASWVDLMEQDENASLKNITQLQTEKSSPAVIDAENYFLQKKIDEVESKLSTLSVPFSYEHISNNDKLILLYTGLPSGLIFVSLYKLLEDLDINYYLGWNVTAMPKIDQLLLTLMKLRQNFPHEDIAQRFNCSQATVTNVILTWIHVMHKILYKQFMTRIPSRAKSKTCLPQSFCTFTNCRIILDCTEIFTAVPRKSMENQRITYSSYKSRNTWKGLVGVAPNGVITYISDLYPGSTSDKKIVQHCGILKQFEAGDLILADKDFLIRDMLPAGVHLNIPPFLVTPQFTPDQVYQTTSIARARIHVERAIRRIKCYNILDFIPNSLLPCTNVIFQLVSALTNLQYPLIREVQEYYVE